MRTSSRKLQVAMVLLAAFPALAAAQRVEVRGSGRVSAQVTARLVIGAHIAVRPAGAPVILDQAADGWTEVRVPARAFANTGWQLSVAGAPADAHDRVEVRDEEGRWVPLTDGTAVRVASGGRVQDGEADVRVRLRDRRDLTVATGLRLRMETSDAR